MPPVSSAFRATFLALALGAIVWYAPLIWWGVPHATAPGRTKTFATDEILPLEALAEMRSTFVAAAPDRNIGYPWWHYFVTAAAQAPYVAAAWVSGGWSPDGPNYPFGFQDPVAALTALTIIGRVVSVLMGAGIVLATFAFAATLWGRPAGLIAAGLTLVSYPMTYYSRTGNLDVPAFFWSAIALAIFARILTGGLTHSRAGWFALFAALGVATKDQSIVLFAPLCLVLALPAFNRTPGRPYQATPLLIALIVGVGAYLTATGMLFDPQRHVAHVEAVLFDRGRITQGNVYFPPAPRGGAGTLALLAEFGSGLAAMMAWPVLLVSIAGFVLAVRDARWHLLWLLPFVLAFLLLVRMPGTMVLRYLLPLTIFVDAFAGYALVRARQSRLRAAVGPMLVVLLASRVLVGLDLSYAQWRDTRYAAADWLQQHYRAGERLEFFGVAEALPPLSATVSSRRIMGREKWVGELHHGPMVLDYLRRDGPTYLVVVPDWTSRPGMEHSADCPPEVFAALVEGRVGYELVAYFPPRLLWPPALGRPRLDNPSVAPPVRIFRRAGGGESSPRPPNPQRVTGDESH